MSYTPVPTGGIEPPHDGATTRCLPIWLSRHKLVAEAGIEPAADGAYEPPLYRLSYSALRLMAAPLGFEPSRPGSKPGALPARRRGPNIVGATCGPRPLDERGDVGAGSENRTRVVCLEGSGSATELCPHWRWCRDRTCATHEVSTR